MANRPQPPDLQEWVARHGGYHNIPWREWDNAVAAYQTQRRAFLFAPEDNKRPRVATDTRPAASMTRDQIAAELSAISGTPLTSEEDATRRRDLWRRLDELNQSSRRTTAA